MQAIVFYISYPLIWAVSKLPLSVLYAISDYVVYPLLYKLLGYRKKVVDANILSVYPNMSEGERQQLASDFYHYLGDLFMETIKGFTISGDELKKRISFENLEFFRELYLRHPNGIVATLGHIGNYEWMAQVFPRLMDVNLVVPYRKMTNPYFDNMFKKSRERGGAKLFYSFDTQKFLESAKDKFLIALANDQSAQPDKSYWAHFLNQDTSFYVGTERVARQKDLAVVYVHINPIKRGYYHLTFDLITETPSEVPIGYVMEKHVEKLENNIHEFPSYWLWSHRRWKHKKPHGFTYGFVKPLA